VANVVLKLGREEVEYVFMIYQFIPSAHQAYNWAGRGSGARVLMKKKD